MRVVFNHQFNDYLKVKVFINDVLHSQYMIYKNFPSYITIDDDNIEKVRFSFETFRREADCKKSSKARQTQSCAGTILPHQLNRNYHYSYKALRPKFPMEELKTLYDTEISGEKLVDNLYLFPNESEEIKGMLYFAAMNYDTFELIEASHPRKLTEKQLNDVYKKSKTLFLLKNVAYFAVLIAVAVLFVRQIMGGNLDNVLKVLGMGILAIACVYASVALPYSEIKTRNNTREAYGIEALNNGRMEWGYGPDEEIPTEKRK